MLLPTGIYVQPAHPAFVQLHQPSHPHPPLFSAPSQLIQQQPVVTQPYLVQQPTASVGHQTATSFIPQPSSYVYLEQDDGL